MLCTNAIGRVHVGTAETALPNAAACGVSDIETHQEARAGLCHRRHPLVHELQRLYRQRLDEAHEGSNDD